MSIKPSETKPVFDSAAGTEGQVRPWQESDGCAVERTLQEDSFGGVSSEELDHSHQTCACPTCRPVAPV